MSMPPEGDAIPGFSSLGLSAAIVKAVTVLGYEEPTPIQRAAIPLLLEGLAPVPRRARLIHAESPFLGIYQHAHLLLIVEGRSGLQRLAVLRAHTGFKVLQ